MWLAAAAAVAALADRVAGSDLDEVLDVMLITEDGAPPTFVPPLADDAASTGVPTTGA